jgi:hypothetical protein
MIAVIICVASLAALMHFFISYARSLVATYRCVELSDQVRNLAEARSSGVSAGEFRRLRQLVGLCPERADDHFQIQAVGAYYELVTFAGAVVKSVPSVLRWLERERADCAHFAAVALEQRIRYSRSLLEHGSSAS